MSILKCLRSPLLSPEGATMPTVRLVAPLGDRGCEGMRQIMYDMALVYLYLKMCKLQRDFVKTNELTTSDF
jgi:hypothetical protein